MTLIFDSNNQHFPSEEKFTDLFKKGDIKTIKSLVSHKDFFQFKNAHGSSPLRLACIHGHIELVDLFLQLNTQVNPIDLPLHIAIEKNQLSIIDSLLNHGADMYFNNPNLLMRQPLPFTLFKSIEALKILMKHGLDVNFKADNGETILASACRLGLVDAVQLLISNNASTSNLNKVGSNALHIASLHNRIELVEYLLSNKMDINSINNDGNTPLHIAADHAYVNMVNLLILHQPDIKIKNNDGFTAYDLATKSDFKNKDIIKAFKIYQNYNKLNKSLSINSVSESISHKRPKI